ncbi:Peptidyl-prolyl cis-trans isomerase B [Gonapodya sp. JEL0774]|nr:Peptidyl-prolyl cis-trans isomerase B [Gonapodya sp. JEL0774]
MIAAIHRNTTAWTVAVPIAVLIALIACLSGTQAAIHDVDITSHVYMNISRGDVPLGRIVFGLYGNVAPKAVQSFRMLSTGEKFVVQAGDWEYNNGTGSKSIYGTVFSDEPKGLKLSHSAEGVLSMANKGPNKNGSQFFITIAPVMELDGKHVVFGRVVSGLDIAMEIGETAVNDKHRPYLDVVIEDCGEIDFSPKRKSDRSEKDTARTGKDEL